MNCQITTKLKVAQAYDNAKFV